MVSLERFQESCWRHPAAWVIRDDAGSINLYLDVDKGTLPVGESMNITVRALNVGYDPVTLTGPSDCLLYVEVLSSQGQVVWHSQGAVQRPDRDRGVGAGLREGPDGESGTAPTWPGRRLTAGFYHIRGIARVTGSTYIGPPLSVSLE